MKSLFAIIILMVTTSVGFSQNTDSKRILFLGNSVFYSRGGLFHSFEGFCKEAGLDYQAVSQWDKPADPLGVEFLDYGRIPLSLPGVAADKKIHALIRSGQFDYVILDGRRAGYLLPDSVDLPDDRGKSIPYQKNLQALESLHRTIVGSGAQTVLYMHPGTQSPSDYKHHVAQIYKRFQVDLSKTKIDGKQHQVILVPAMMLWLDALKKYGIEGWYADHNHGNGLARYASGCMLYAYLTGKDPRQSQFKKLTVLGKSWKNIPESKDLVASEQDAKWIKKQVWLYYLTRH
jgi:hypothetical protein